MIKLGLIGHPIAHSRSPELFAEISRTEGVPLSYNLFPREEISRSELEFLFQQNQLTGLNVTLPLKQKIMPLLDVVDDKAQAIGAVNTVVLEDGKFVGYNTDYAGIAASLKQLGPAPQRALVLGNGGAAQAVKAVLKDSGIPFTVVARRGGDVTFDALTAAEAGACHWWIQCTPVGNGLGPVQALALPYDELSSKYSIFDLIYSPEITSTMQSGISRGAKVLGGMLMLKEQARESWTFFSRAYYK